MTTLGHVISTAAIWCLMLTGARFGVASVQWLGPARRALWRLLRCREPGREQCRTAFRATIERLHVNLRRAMTAPWSASLLFVGSALIGFGFTFGCAGDMAKLISRSPQTWQTFDVVTDCIAAAMAVTGMAFVQAVTATHRTVSLMVSIGLVITGLGIGVVTL
ncbi:hypothetical protein NZL82_14040 [Sphingomonas sanguinis]|uniref:hypothetical protein n=1 Tax=Sphingomonas sp. LC-1 TaxID=3110957 RepID=UPI0021BB151E|nr:hypothetical protein [Sphingomonas sp. LC-1]MCT8002997.1 hypothetical protein [Sphingomonas sp. LC-1]